MEIYTATPGQSPQPAFQALQPAFQAAHASTGPQQSGPGKSQTQLPADQSLAAAREFEAMVIATMLEPMFAGIKADNLFGGGQSEKIYQSMLIQEYAKSMSANGGIGLADSVHREMLKMQELP